MICSICLENIKEDVPDLYKGKLVCNHEFHPMCILEWFKHSNTCPICRNSQVSEEHPIETNIMSLIVNLREHFSDDLSTSSIIQNARMTSDSSILPYNNQRIPLHSSNTTWQIQRSNRSRRIIENMRENINSNEVTE